MSQEIQRVEIILDNDCRPATKSRLFKVIQAAYGFDHHCGDGKLVPANTNHHRALDSQAGRELHGKRSALAWHGFDFKRASEARNTITYHIQANATTTLFTQHLSSRETW